MTLTIAQRQAIFDAIPEVICGEQVPKFEDDGGGWHVANNIESWITFSVSLEGQSELYTVNALLSSQWDPVSQKYYDDIGRINRGIVNIYVCSTDKLKMQGYVAELTGLIERTRLGLSLDYEGIVTGYHDVTVRKLGSYSDNRLKKRVWRMLVEVPILYKFSQTKIVEPIRRIGLQTNVAPNEELVLRATIFLAADGLLADSSFCFLSASMLLD